MPFYNDLSSDNPEGKRTIQRLLALKQALRDIPAKTVDETLLLATWNIRDFDKPAYGARSDEAIYYIAEIISRFDLVAVQEVYKDLTALHRLIKVLGGYWKYVITDVTEGRQGNDEVMAYLYDSRKVSFGGLAGEMVLPPVKTADGKVVAAEQVWRTPYICGFRCGWSRFMLCSVHILWGKGETRGKKEPDDRIAEVRKVAQFLRSRTLDKTSWSRNLILLGDFNIFSTKEEGGAFSQLLDAGFEIPESMRNFVTNAKKDRSYDQIAFRVQEDRLAWTGKAGVFDYYNQVFTGMDEEIYADQMGPAYLKTSKGKVRTVAQRSTYYATNWRTHQMSDHLPLWVELKIDFSEQYLRRKAGDEA